MSYHTNVGHYSASGAYFSSLGIDRSPLHAPPTATVGGNGVFVYGASAFPTQTFNATNYWVDVVFDSTPDTIAPMIADVSATAIDSSTAVVTWTTDESATSSGRLLDLELRSRPRRRSASRMRRTSPRTACG